MKQTLWLSLLSSIYLSANDVEIGRTLYLGAKCQQCHLRDAKFDPNSIKKEGMRSKVSSMKQIKKWVVSCDNYFDIGWFPEDQEKVVEYLDSVYYKFDHAKVK